MTCSPPCLPVFFDLMMALRSTETHSSAVKKRSYLGLDSEFPRVPIRLRGLARNNAVEFSMRKMQLTRLRTKLLRQVVEDMSCLFWSYKHGKCSVERLILQLKGKVNFLLQIHTKFY